MKKGLLAMCMILFICAVFLPLPSKVQACSCAAPASVQEELQRSAGVFSGKLVKITDPGQTFMRSSADPLKVTFAAATIWKGDKGPEITINTPMSSASCGYTFETGKDYLVYASSDGNGQLQTYLCSRTKLLASAAEDLAGLGPGEKPAAYEGPTQGEVHSSTVHPLYLVIIFVAVFFISLVAVRMLYGMYLTKKHVPDMMEAYKAAEKGELPSTIEFGTKGKRKSLIPVMISTVVAAAVTVIVYFLLISV